MLQDYLERKQITEDLLVDIVGDLNCYIPIDIYFSAMVNVNFHCILTFGLDTLRFDTFVDCYNFLKKLISQLVSEEEKYQKEERVLRDMLVSACGELAHKYNYKRFCVSMNKGEEE